MGCECTETKGFNAKLKEAVKATKATGIEHVVWVVKINNTKSPLNGRETVYMGAEDVAQERLKAKKICCYYKSDGSEVTKVKRKKKSSPVQELSGTTDT